MHRVTDMLSMLLDFRFTSTTARNWDVCLWGYRIRILNLTYGLDGPCSIPLGRQISSICKRCHLGFYSLDTSGDFLKVKASRA